MIVEELSTVPSLTETDRRLWLRARDDFPPVSSARPWFVPAAFVSAVAALLLVSLGIGLTWRSISSRKTHVTVVVVVAPEIVKASTLREVENIQIGVGALARELDELGHEADLLDARRNADALALQFAPRTTLNDL